MHQPVKSCIAVAALLLSILPGCSSGDGFERIGVSGDVTHRGEPVVQGQIRFVPQPGTMAPLVVEAIRDGRYATTTTGGVPVGAFRVEIRAFDPNAPPQKSPLDPPPRQLLPDEFNTNSQLEAVFKSGDTDGVLDFNLE